MKWIWGDKRSKKTPLKFSAEQALNSVVRTKVKVHYVLDVEFPKKEDITQVLRDIQYDMQLPPGVTVHDGEITFVEVYGDNS